MRDRDGLQNYDKFRQVLFQVICQGDKLMGLLFYLPIHRGPLTPSHLRGRHSLHATHCLSYTNLHNLCLYKALLLKANFHVAQTHLDNYTHKHAYITRILWQETCPQWDCQSSDRGKGVQERFESRERVCVSYGGVQWFSYAATSK